MAFPLIFGWDSEVEKLAYYGLHKCSNCNNITNFYLYGKYIKLTIFFIPIIKIFTKRFVSCVICNHGFQVNKEEANQIILHSYFLPDEAEIHAIFTIISNYFKDTSSSVYKYVNENKNIDYSTLLDIIINLEELNTIEKGKVDYVLKKYLKFRKIEDDPEIKF